MEKIILNEKEVIEIYYKFNNIHKVAKYFGVSSTPIRRVLKSNGLILNNRRYEVDETYFDVIDTEEKAYWLGFLFADGYIRERKSGMSLELKLSTKDINHLELFRNCIKSNHIIQKGWNKVKYKGGLSSSEICCLAIYSKKMVESIKKLGIHTKKTFTIGAPKIDEVMFRHFIRGYFDGDGSFSFKSGNLYGKTQIVSASEEFKKFIIEELKKNGIEIKLYSGIKLQIQNKLNNNKFYNFIYENSKIYLKRKKEKYDEFRKHYGYNN